MTTPNHHDYRRERIKRGSQTAVALALGVDRGTIIRREQEQFPITREAWLALMALPLLVTPPAAHPRAPR